MRIPLSILTHIGCRGSKKCTPLYKGLGVGGQGTGRALQGCVKVAAGPSGRGLGLGWRGDFDIALMDGYGNSDFPAPLRVEPSRPRFSPLKSSHFPWIPCTTLTRETRWPTICV